VNEVELGQVFSKYFCFSCHSLHQLLSTHNRPSSGADTIGQRVAQAPSGLVSLPPQESYCLSVQVIRKLERWYTESHWPFTLMSVCVRGSHEDVWRSGGIAPLLLTSALDGGDWSPSGACRITPGGSVLAGWSGLCGEKENLHGPGIEPGPSGRNASL
jgi:hypothetical protein